MFRENVKMNVAVIAPSRKKAGPVIVAADQIKLLSERGHSCKLFYLDDGPDEVQFVCPAEKISLRTSVDFSAYDVVHCHGLRPCFYITRHKPLCCKTAFVTTLHSYIFRDFCCTYGKLKGIAGALVYLCLLLRFDKIITLSRDALRYYKRLLFFKRFDFLYNTVDPVLNKLPEEQYQELMNFKQEAVLLGINAVLSRGKGQQLVLSALPELPGCKLFLLGSGPNEASLRALAEKLGVADRVCFAGFRKNAVDYLPYYDLFILPTYSEGCPLALLEAAASGKKIVCSNIPVLVEMFRESPVVFFDINHPETLAPAIQKALAEEEVREKMICCFEEKFSKEAVAEKLLQIYESC